MNRVLNREGKPMSDSAHGVIVVDVHGRGTAGECARAVFPDAVYQRALMQNRARVELVRNSFVLPSTRTDCVVSLRILLHSKELPLPVINRRHQLRVTRPGTGRTHSRAICA